MNVQNNPNKQNKYTEDDCMKKQLNEIIKEFKVDYKDKLQFCIDTDFTFEHVPLLFFTEIENLYEKKWKLKLLEITDENSKKVLTETVELLNLLKERVSKYLVFHEGFGVLIFNKKIYDNPFFIDEIRTNIDDIRRRLYKQYEKVYALS